MTVKMVAAGLTFCCGGFLKKANNLRFYKWEHRLYSQQNVLKKATSYTSTILLPKTEYPARHKAAKRVQVDSDIHKAADFEGLYCWQRDNLKGPDYILHDGPPYANGDPHMGHAVNKILKDITLRNQVVRGRRVHYIPGWDCHGLPIELKALNADKKDPKVLITKSSMGAIQLREMARKFAVETAYTQREVFRRWGLVADWDNQCYYTNDKVYVKNQLRQFYNMYERGFIYRDLKPVYWSPSSGSALAEAELEYDPHHKSTQVYLELPLINVPEQLKAMAPNANFSAVIWTTTPWSLVGNQAVCYTSSLRYSAVKSQSRPDDGQLLIVATSLLEDFNKALETDYKEVFSFEGSVLSSALYHHPLRSGVTLPFLQGDHVSAEKGTGLVHTAPAHGPEDFLVALKNNMKIHCYVDEEGRFSDFDSGLDGLLALKDGQSAVIERLGARVLRSGPFLHPYPLDWRTKQPLIVRASSQWFVDTGKLKEQALAALKDVTILPASSSAQYRLNLTNQVQNRPYWCISRQRVWGVPIPVVYDGERALITRDLVERVCDGMDMQGVNSWWNNAVDERLISADFLRENDTSMARLVKGKDIMDIWLDSGLTWSSVLGGHQADLYLEGLDQCTGWFQSSLLTSVALTGKAPYKSLFVHGFTVDSKGRKMSKSVGNVVDPKLIIEGGKNLNKNPAYGIDTVRWWVASHGTQNAQVIISDNILTESNSEISRLRLLMKFLLGAISDLDQHTLTETQQFGYVDSYMLHELREFQTQLNAHYETMQYNKVCMSILHFTTNQVSGFYCHIVKDRLYCQGKNSVERMSCQVVFHNVLVSLCQALGPIIPHFVEEVWSHHPLNDGKAFFKTVFDPPKEIWNRPFVDMLMESVIDIRKDLNKKCAGLNSLEYTATIRATAELYDRLYTMQGCGRSNSGELCEVLQVSEVVLTEAEVHEEEWVLSVEKVDKLQCGRCRRFTAKLEDEPCERCANVMAESN